MDSFWTGFEKRASEPETDYKSQAALSGAAGLAALHHAGDRITGHETVYHGTKPELVAKIKKEGLKPHFGGTGGSAVEGSELFKDLSKNMVHVTKRKSVARSYAAMGRGHDPLTAFIMGHVPGTGRGGVVKAKIPYDAWNKKFELDPLMLGNKAHAARTSSAIAPNLVVGGEGHKRLGWLKNVGSYAKKHPGRFASGVGLATAGIGGLALAHHLLKKEHAKQAAASGAVYHRDLATDTTIHSMQEDSYPSTNIYSFFNPNKAPKKKKSLDAIEGLFNDPGEDANDRSNAGQPARYLGTDTFTLGHAEGG